MMRFVLAIKPASLSGLWCSAYRKHRIRLVQLSIAFGLLFASGPMVARAQIDIGALGSQATMAEQGAICASFAALMENQTLINQDLGDLWSERRKFSGAVIRRAVELSNLPSPKSTDIDLLINDYREWLILNLSAKDSEATSLDYQSDVKDLIRTNCKSLYVQADKAIQNRYPRLGYLIDKQSADATNNQQDAQASQQSAQQAKQQIDTLMAKNNELNVKVIALRAEISALKNRAQAAIKEQASNPKPDHSQNSQIQAPETTASNPQTPAPKLAKPTPRPAHKGGQKASAKTPTTDDKTSRFYAQLGSFSNAASAKIARASYEEKYPQLFEKIELQITPHLFASGKTFYRVQTSSAVRPAITRICDKLWDARMGCLIKTNID